VGGRVDKEISMHQSSVHSVSSANSICKQRESFRQLEVWR